MDMIASLDRKILQAQLDKQLADYEKVRADFEIFVQKNPNPTEAIDKYLKTEKQASLNASVKEVELAKALLDNCDLISPVDGVVMDDSGIVTGINVSPTSSEVKIIDSSSYYFEIELTQTDIHEFRNQREVTIKIEGVKEEIKGNTSQLYSDGKSLFVKVPVNNQSVLMGMQGEASF